MSENPDEETTVDKKKGSGFSHNRNPKPQTKRMLIIGKYSKKVKSGYKVRHVTLDELRTYKNILTNSRVKFSELAKGLTDQELIPYVFLVEYFGDFTCPICGKKMEFRRKAVRAEEYENCGFPNFYIIEVWECLHCKDWDVTGSQTFKVIEKRRQHYHELLPDIFVHNKHYNAKCIQQCLEEGISKGEYGESAKAPARRTRIGWKKWFEVNKNLLDSVAWKLHMAQTLELIAKKVSGWLSVLVRYIVAMNDRCVAVY